MLNENQNRDEEFPTLLRSSKTIEYRKYKADFKFEVDFGLNGTISTVATWWDLSLFGKSLIHYTIFSQIQIIGLLWFYTN